MRAVSNQYIADNTTLSNFARSGYLDLLKKLFPDGVCTTSDVVDELKKGVTKYTDLQRILDEVGGWLIEIEELSPQEVSEQGRLKQQYREIRKGADSGLIAVAKIRGMILLSDDRAVQLIAQSEGIEIFKSAEILHRAFQQGLINEGELYIIANAIALQARYPRILQELSPEEQ